MADVVRLEPKPRRYTLTIEHHSDGRITVLIIGVNDGSATRATIRDILQAALTAIEVKNEP